MAVTFTRTGEQIEEIHNTVDGVFDSFANKNLIKENHNFIEQSTTVTPPDSTPRNYSEGDEIFKGVFVDTGGVQGLTYSNGVVNFSSGGGYYFKVPNTEALVYISELTSSVSDKNGAPISGDNLIVSHNLVGAEYRVYVKSGSSNVFSVKLEEGPKATRHEIGDLNEATSSSKSSREILTLSQGQTTVNLSTPVAGEIKVSVSNPGVIDGEEILEGRSYQLISSTQIELLDTYPQGTSLIVIGTIDEEASGNPNGSYIDITFQTKAQLQLSSLSEGYKVSVSGIGSAEFIIRDSAYSPKTGDVTISNGNVASLQLDSSGQFNVAWFGASGDDGSVDQTASFSLAATRYSEEENGTGKAPDIVVPVGNWRLDSDTLEASWILMRGADIEGLGGVPPTGVNDTSRLKGRVINYNQGYNQFNSVRYGDQTYAVQKYTSKAFIAEVMSFGRPEVGGGGGAFGVNVKDRPGGQNATGIGLSGVAVNDMDNDYAATWGLYVESTKGPTATGPTWGAEITTVNQNPDLVTQTPYRQGSGSGATFGLMLNSGDELDGSYPSGVVSCAMDIFGKAGGTFNRGIIFREGGIDTQEMISAPSGYRFTWYGERSSDGVEQRACDIRGQMPGDTGQVTLSVFTANEADRKSVALSVWDFSPLSNGDIDYGGNDRRIRTVYQVNSPDVSSDEALKKQRSALTQDEISAALQIAQLPRMFQWLSEIKEKGSLTGQTVYLHCSPMAQEVWSAFEGNNLDPMLYGFINDGDDYGAKWSLQPQELLWMICAAQQSKINDFESRLAALENNNG